MASATRRKAATYVLGSWPHGYHEPFISCANLTIVGTLSRPYAARRSINAAVASSVTAASPDHGSRVTTSRPRASCACRAAESRLPTSAAARGNATKLTTTAGGRPRRDVTSATVSVPQSMFIPTHVPEAGPDLARRVSSAATAGSWVHDGATDAPAEAPGRGEGGGADVPVQPAASVSASVAVATGTRRPKRFSGIAR